MRTGLSSSSGLAFVYVSISASDEATAVSAARALEPVSG
jgi:hypothetical protein